MSASLFPSAQTIDLAPQPTVESASRPAAFTAVTVQLPGSRDDLLTNVPVPTGVLSFLSEGEGLVGWGTYASFTASGPDAAAHIAAWWADLSADLIVSDDVGVPGSGPIVFISLGFDDTDTSVALVPQTVLGSRDGRRFRTTIGPATMAAPPAQLVPVTAPGRISYSDAAVSVSDYIEAVTAGISRIRAGELKKVVLAHDLVATAENVVDERYVLSRLSQAYPTCWTFAVAGLVGATPEMLLRRRGLRISSRVLAGTAWSDRAGAHTAGTVATGLLASSKDLAEHAYAVDSVASVLGAVSADLQVPGAPRALPLANLTHLATDITGTLPAESDGPSTSALALAAALHPSAAVGGFPKDVARGLIRELEPMERGRYAAPVGWMNAAGEGEFAIALRCAEISGNTVRMMAGCGIMADSDPEKEAREAQIKMIPVRDALEG
ncbi:isochorismate synthase [Nakamurella antarctica]|uniref:isochorismate synthase n=1 Tax=Nakamurella antarctica TaxID=1902245 RepID=A0A3G8ZNN4_9ACTN|nr:isochorismate synthase [Nakamurella antarctica]AZI58748.1 isochorismate synthase [Nakamurella antarctica]